MNLITALIGAILTFICILPFLLMVRNIKKLEKQTLQSLYNIAAQQNSTITQHELCGNIAVGLDENSRKFFFFKKEKNKLIARHLDLDQFQKCTVVNTRRTFKHEGKSDSIIEKLEMSFLPIAKNQAPLKLEFYDLKKSRQMNGELQLVENWTKILSNKIKAAKVMPQVA